MCGIAGIIGSTKINDAESLMQMACKAMSHRGPDYENYFINKDQTVALAHTRLSIIDLSANANQPFSYLQYKAVFNGEIYNFKQLRLQLKNKNYQFTTNSDTEVLIAAYDNWGLECLNKFDGMFSFVIYNIQTKTAFAARDAFGQKPFYFAQQNHQFYFASELHTLFSLGISKIHNYTEWLNYLALGHTSNANDITTTFYNNIYHLPAGHFVEINLQTISTATSKKWYNINDDKINYDNNVVEQFTFLFDKTIANTLVADVPVATSLSGGVDSSCIVTSIHNLKQKDNYSYKTYTASFPRFDKDETTYSNIICKQLNIEQILVKPTVNDWITQLHQLLKHQQEPTQSSSVLTQWLVYKTAAEQGIKVIIDGQGADELLGGYSKQVEWYLLFFKKTNYGQFKKLVQLLQTNQFVGNWDKGLQIASLMPLLIQAITNYRNTNQVKFSKNLNKEFVSNYYNKSTTQKPPFHSFKELLHYHTTTFGLPSLLRFADRNSMAFGLEVRLPFLSKELASFLFHLKDDYKVKDGFTKHILRAYLQQNNLADIAWRNGKIGFEPPQQLWMQNKQVQEMIVDAKTFLLKQKIISSTYAHEPINPINAHAKNNMDWRILNMALLMQ